MKNYKNIWLKLSGEALSNSNDIYDKKTLLNIVDQIKQLLLKKINLSIVTLSSILNPLDILMVWA